MMLILLAAGMCLASVRAFSSSVAPRTFCPASSRLYSSSDTQETKAYFLDDDEAEIMEGNVRVEINSKEPATGNEHDPAKKDATVSAHANTVKQPSSKEETSDKQQLSDIDARVLKAMLQEDKLGLQQKENMKKLLERGVAPKSAPSFETQQKVEEEEDDSPFSSQLFKTLANTKLWKGLKRDAGNLMESVGIFVANRIERDAKLLGAVGLFAWERAVRDVARALPASGTSGAAVGRAMRQAARQLGNSSSFEQMQEQQKSLQDLDNLYEELNTPMDEIKSVTRSIRDILKGETVTTASGRRLRSVAPAGQINNAERQRRAYRRRKASTLKQEKEILNLQRAAGTVIDTAAEVRRELQVESSVPGYRTEVARKAIAASAAETQRFLASAKRDGWSKALFAPSKDVQKDNIRLLVEAENVETVKDEVNAQAVSQLIEEQTRVVERLDWVIANPGGTWLTAEVVRQFEGEVDEKALGEVVTAMILARDQWESTDTSEYESLSPAEMVELLRDVKRTVDSITSLAASCAGMAGAQCLRNVLYGLDEEDADSRPSLLTLDEVEPSIAAAVEVAESLPDIEEDESPYVDGEVIERTVVAEVVSEVHDRTSGTVSVMSQDSPRTNEVYITDFYKEYIDSRMEDAEYDRNIRMASAEVISDDDFENAVGAKRVASVDDKTGQGEKKDDIIATVLLRSLDVLVLVIEKVFTSVIPNAVILGSTASTRLADVVRDGMGTKGWKKLANVQSGSKRY